MNRVSRTFFMLACAIILTACHSTAVAPSRSNAQKQADVLLAPAIAYLQQQQAGAAEQELRSVLLQLRSVDDLEGIARTSLLLADTLTRNKKTSEAATILAEISSDKALLYNDSYRAQAYYQQALLLAALPGTATNNTNGKTNDSDDRAQHAAEQALALCHDCAALPAIHNLLARIFLQKNQSALAKEQANTALHISQQHAANSDNRREQANALRLLARLGIEQQPETATAQAEQALQLDKTLARSDRIAEDLWLLELAAEKRGLAADQQHYRARRLSVCGTQIHTDSTPSYCSSTESPSP